MLALYAIEFTNRCNLLCTHCPTGLRMLKYARGNITLENFNKGLEYLRRFPYDAGMHLHGEPFLHPKACELIALSKKTTNIRVCINTNGTVLTESLCKDIVDTGIDNVEISVHTEKSLLGFKNLFDANEAAEKIEVIANILPCYYDFAKGWIKNIGITKKYLRCMRFVTQHNWAIDVPSLENKKIRQENCQFINNNVCVMKWDGKIYSCCFDFDGDNYMGTIDDLLAGTLKHTPDTYKLCVSCSASWATNSSPNMGFPLGDDWLD